MPKCLKCEKNLEFEFDGKNLHNTTPVDGGGFLEASFHFGSRHDKVQAYICDDCFGTHLELFEGWDDVSIPQESRKV